MFYLLQFVANFVTIVLAQTLFFPLGVLLFVVAAVIAAFIGADAVNVWLAINATFALLMLCAYKEESSSPTNKKDFLAL